MSEEIENIIEESLSPDRYCLVHNYIVSLQQKKEQLENIRKEAIKLLKKCGIVDEKGNFNAYLDTIELKDLLNILNKGSDKE